jgi:hypothetical protein
MASLGYVPVAILGANDKAKRPEEEMAVDG